MDALFRIEMLGRFTVWQGNRQITRFRTQKTASLLAYLSLYRARSHPREALIACFWPDSPLEAARTNLSVALNALRRQLEPPGVPAGMVLITDHTQARLNPIAFTSDVEDFESLLHEAQKAWDADQRRGFYKRAVEVYCGDLLPGHYEEWVLGERDRLREAYLGTLRQMLKEMAESRQLEQALVYGRRLVQADPLREESYRHLMRLYAALGRAREALNVYTELERLLQKEMQSSASSATRELAEQLRRLAPKMGKPTQARAASIRTEETPVTIDASLPEVKRSALKIPLQFTRFFGREEVIAHLMEALSILPEAIESDKLQPSGHPPRLFTLTGPGGTGKTRLSIEVVGRMKEAFGGGIWFVALAELNDPLLIGEALRDVLELPRQTQPSALEQVIAYLNGRQQPCLLILDNFEQIAAGGASVVWTLLRQVALLHCLVTSRKPLSLPGEQEIPLSPLPIPVLEGLITPATLLTTHLLTFPSVALFVDRAQTASPDFQITKRNAQSIATICAKLEGLPLAIELAAARVNVLTPAQIQERLAERFDLLSTCKSDRGEHHRSLWATIDWSYHLLAPSLQRFFARLSVFRGNWSLEAAEETCQEPLALEYMEQLQAHSLILSEESTEAVRFQMLESIREFAGEQFGVEERAEIERRHAEYFHRTVLRANLPGAKKAASYARFEEDLDNLRAVLEWSLQEGKEIEIGLQTAGRLDLFWYRRGYLSEGRRWYDRLLKRAEDTPTKGLSMSLYGAGLLTYYQGDFPAARSLLERSLECAQALGNERDVESAHTELGSIAYRMGDYQQARFHYEITLTMARAQGKSEDIASALGNLANVAHAMGDFSVAHKLNEESLELSRIVGNRYGEARTLNNLADLFHCQDQLAQARIYYEQSLAIKRELEDRYGICSSLAGLAFVEKDQGDYAASAAHARESLALAKQMNVRMILVYLFSLLIALMLPLGELEVAARMCGAFKRVVEEMGYQQLPIQQQEFEQIQAVLQEQVGTAHYENAQAQGRALSLEEALTCLEEILASRSL